MSKKKGLVLTAAMAGLVAMTLTGCSRKQEPQMIDVASRLEQARAQRSALAAQTPSEPVQTAVVQPVQRKVSYVK
ncbi:MAG: hypothetical protein FGM27_06865 [Candidatus Omnitrophica bacterium]|nr:hypothetical protein [Candidatus Omnitrophota bacterium]